MNSMSTMAPMLLLVVTLMLMPLGGKCGNDKEVLLSLKQGILDPTGALKDWIPGTGICNWTGIICDPLHKGHVQSISLGNRNLHGTLTHLLGRLQYLTVLNFDLNNLTGSIPASLENCSHLTNISLGSNQLSGIIPTSLDKAQGLRRLDLWNNQLQGTIPASLGNCTMLDYLSLGQNYLSGLIPPQLGRLGKLVLLRIFTNNFVGSFPTFFTNCTQLQIMSIRNNSLTGFIPKELEKLVSLQQLRIQSNLFQGTLPPHIGNMSSLYYMDISINKLSGNIPSSFGLLRNIQEMYLNNNNLTGPIPEELSRCQQLRNLDLSHNSLEGLPDSIGDMQALTNLTLDDNFISGSIPGSLGKLYRMISLDLSYNLLSGQLPSSLAGLQNIELGFNLGHNLLSGPIPAWIGNFRMVQSISLEANNLSGNIPPSIVQCLGLSWLSLSGNQLVGTVPENIGNLKFLRKLDLAANQLSGGIPSSLASLPDLASLNVSFNHLTGPIPEDGPFKMFKLTDFVGNPALCGPVLDKVCNGRSSLRKIHKSTILISVAALILILVCGWFSYIYLQRMKRPKNLEDDVPATTGGPLVSYTPEELLDMTQDYNEDNLIGTGGLSSVYKGMLPKHEVVAVKLLGIDMPDEARRSFIAEVQTLGRVRHRNLVKLLGYCWTRNMKALILEYMPNGSLEQYLKENVKDGAVSLDWRTRVKIALGVAQGMSYLHHEFDFPIIHCDLKPANVLLDSNFEAHVADFGISKVARSDKLASISIFRGSIGYAPPEYASSTYVSTKGDIYSYGMLLLEIVTGKSPMNEIFDNACNLREWVNSGFPSRLLEVVDPLLLADTDAYHDEMRNVVQLALACTSHLPNSRPTMQQVLSTMTSINNGVTPKKVLPSLDLLVNSPSPYTLGIPIQVQAHAVQKAICISARTENIYVSLLSSTGPLCMHT